jgi:L-ribulose-5-phosphate 3-epimerase
MLLGYNTNGFASHGLDDALTVIAGIGYRSVGLTLDHHALNPWSADAADAVRRCRRRVEALALVPVVETGARFLLDPWRKHRPTLLEDDAGDRRRREEFLERAVDIAADLGAPAVSLWSGAGPVGADSSALDDRLVVGLERLADRATGRGIVLALEPEPGMHVSTMDDFQRIQARLQHPALKLTLDVGHAHLTESEGAVATVRRFAPALANVHLEGMQRPHHDHLLPWDGDMDLPAVLRALEVAGYAGPATFELSRHSHDAVEVARKAFAFAQEAREPDLQKPGSR